MRWWNLQGNQLDLAGAPFLVNQWPLLVTLDFMHDSLTDATCTVLGVVDL